MAKAFRITSTILGALQAAADYDAMAARAADLTRPLSLLGTAVCQRTRRDLDVGKYGVQSRSRMLGSSLTFNLPSTTALELGSNAAQARLLQQGGTVQGVQSQNLTIPIADNLNARGQAKYHSPREVPDGKFIETSEGKVIFIRPRPNLRKPREQKGKRNTFQKAMAALALPFSYFNEVLFLLMPSVTIKAYEWVRWVEAEDGPRWERVASDWIVKGK